MRCEKCTKGAPLLLEVITGQGHYVVDDGSGGGHSLSNIARPIDLKQRWCIPCVKETLEDGG